MKAIILSRVSTREQEDGHSNFDEKRQLVAFVFSNLQLRGRKLEFSMRSPFDLLVNRVSYEGWLGDLDSNQD